MYGGVIRVLSFLRAIPAVRRTNSVRKSQRTTLRTPLSDGHMPHPRIRQEIHAPT